MSNIEFQAHGKQFGEMLLAKGVLSLLQMTSQSQMPLSPTYMKLDLLS